MQAASSIFSTVGSSWSSKGGSLRQFARIGAVIVGVIGGSISVSNEHSAQLATYKAKLAERDGEIAELKAAISKREMEKNGISSGVVSSGDPVQDWIDSLVE